MTFNVRRLQWSDVKITLGHLDSKDNQRVYVALEKTSFVGLTLWIPDWKESPAQQAMVLLLLNRKLLQTIEKLDYYVL